MDFDKIHTLLDIVLKSKDFPHLLLLNQQAMAELMKIAAEAEEAAAEVAEAWMMADALFIFY